MASVSSARVPTAVGADPRFAEAYRALRADPRVQFDLVPVQPRPKLPGWIETLGHWVTLAFRPIGRLIGWLVGLMPKAPYARILLWTILALLAAAILWAIIDRARSGSWRLPRRGRNSVKPTADAEWATEAGSSRAWLQEADLLAAEGDYAEAIHHLLRRSVEDIAKRRPRLIAPALTSRDIAANRAIPPGARSIFAGIALAVERSLFGGRAVGIKEWTACRTAYADLSNRATWAA